MLAPKGDPDSQGPFYARMHPEPNLLNRFQCERRYRIKQRS